MYFGVDYHPEQWIYPYGGTADKPEAAWEQDAALMVEAGVNVTGWHEIPHGRLQRFVPHPVLHRSDVEARAKHACCIRGSEGFQIEL